MHSRERMSTSGFAGALYLIAKQQYDRLPAHETMQRNYLILQMKKFEKQIEFFSSNATDEIVKGVIKEELKQLLTKE